MTVRCRLARPEERRLLEQLQLRASLALPSGYRQALLDHPELVSLPAEQITDRRVVVAEEAQMIVGFAVVLPRDDGDAELDGLFVEPVRWRRGIGRTLIAEASLLAHGFGALRLHVIANRAAEAFYRACGFESRGQTETLFEPALLMLKNLT